MTAVKIKTRGMFGTCLVQFYKVQTSSNRMCSNVWQSACYDFKKKYMMDFFLYFFKTDLHVTLQWVSVGGIVPPRFILSEGFWSWVSMWGIYIYINRCMNVCAWSLNLAWHTIQGVFLLHTHFYQNKALTQKEWINGLTYILYYIHTIVYHHKLGLKVSRIQRFTVICTK